MASFLDRAHWRWSAALLAVVLHVVLLSLYYQPATKGLAGDERSYLETAQALRAGVTPEPSLWPPLYAQMLALLGVDEGHVWRAQAVQIIGLLLAAVLLVAIARRVVGPGPGATVAGLLMLTYPPMVAFTHYLWPETVHLVLFLGAVWIVVARHRDPRWMPLLGLLLGLALLTKSLLLPFVPVMILALLRGDDASRPHAPRQHESRWRKRRWTVGLTLGALVLTLAPTAIANHRRMGSLSLSSSGWFNVWAGLRDTSRRSLVDPMVNTVYREYRAAGNDPQSRNAAARQEVASLIRNAGLVPTVRAQLARQYFRLFDKDSYLTAQLPGARLATIRQGYRGPSRPLTQALRLVSYTLYAAVLMAAVAGLVVRQPPGVAGHRLILSFLLYNLGLFLILHVKSRYRIQMMPFFFLYVGNLVNWFQSRHVAPKSTPPLTGRQWLMLTAGIVLVLFLAFGAPYLDASKLHTSNLNAPHASDQHPTSRQQSHADDGAGRSRSRTSERFAGARIPLKCNVQARACGATNRAAYCPGINTVSIT